MEFDGKQSDPSYNSYCQTLVYGFLIFSSNPMLFVRKGPSLVSSTPNVDTDFSDEAIRSMVGCALSVNKEVRRSASHLLLKFVERKSLERFRLDQLSDDTNNVCYHIYRTYGITCRMIADRTMTLELSDPLIQHYLLLIESQLEARCILAQMNNWTANNGAFGQSELIESPRSRLALSRTLETCMLSCLCSTDMETSKMAMSIINWLCQEALLTEDFDKPAADSNWSIMSHFSMYSELSSQAYVATGTVALHKRLYRFLQSVTDPSPGLVGAWNLAYEKWRRLSVLVSGLDILSTNISGVVLGGTVHLDSSAAKTPIFDSAQSTATSLQKREWRSLSGFLASLLAALLSSNSTPVPVKQSTKLFISEMLQLLVCPNPVVRETMREILTRDVAPLGYHQIFKQLENRLVVMLNVEPEVQSHFKETPPSHMSHADTHSIRSGRSVLSGQSVQSVRSVDEENRLLIIEQSTLLIRAVIQRLYDGDLYLSVDVGALSLLILNFLRPITNDIRTLKLKYHACQLIETVSQYKDSLNLKHEYEVRNQLVAILSDWLDKRTASRHDQHSAGHYFSSSSPSIDAPIIPPELVGKEWILRDHYVSIIKALTGLLNGLPIQAPESVHEKDLVESRTAIFNFLFALFLRVCDRCFIEEAGNLPKECVSLAEKLPIIKSETILAISNLVTANVEIGLKVALPLGYHSNIALRLAFLEIFKNILSEGTQLSPEFSEKRRYEELVNFLIENKRATITLCEVCLATEVDEFSTALLGIFEARRKALPLVKTMVSREISNADSPLVVLRRNCVATKLLSIYAKSRGRPYLLKILGPFITKLIEHPDNYVFEINALKRSDSDSAEEHDRRFETTLSMLVDLLSNSLDKVPGVIKEICVTIAKTVSVRFPNDKSAVVTAVSSFFLLRFVCPALVSPYVDEKSIVAEPPSKEVKRTCLILAKALQTLAYGSGYAKLSIADSHRDLMKQKSDVIMKFLRELASGSSISTSVSSPQTTSSAPIPLTADEAFHDDQSSQISVAYSGKSASSTSISQIPETAPNRADLLVVHRFLYNHWEDINHKILMEQRMKRLQTGNGGGPHTIAGHQNSNSLASAAIHKSESNLSVSSHSSTVRSQDDLDIGAKTNKVLTGLVRMLGRPPSDASRQLPVNMLAGKNASTRLMEFLTRNAHRDMGPVIDQRIVFEGVSKEGLPLIICCARNYNRQQIDTELLICRFLEVAFRLAKDKFGLLYDMTGYGPDNAIPSSAYVVLDLLVSDEITRNCISVYCYNVPATVVPRLKGMIKQYPLMPGTQFHFLTPNDIGSKVSLSGLGLGARSEMLVTDVRFVYSKAVCLSSETNEFLPISIKLGDEYLQFQSENPVNVVKGSPCFSNDSYHLSELTDIYVSSDTGRSNEFTIEIGDLKLRVLHKKRQEIIRALLRSKSGATASVATGSNAESSTINGVSNNGAGNSDPTGFASTPVGDDGLSRLLNIAMSNLCSHDPNLQQAAYNLLATLQARFNLSLGREIKGGPGIAIPKNDIIMVMAFSKALAEGHPELTYEFVFKSIEAYENTAVDRRQSVILYTSMWIPNVYQYVYSLGDNEGSERCAKLIRKLIDVSVKNARDYSCALLHIWRPLSLEPALAHLLVSEVIFSLDGENEVESPQGHDQQSLLSHNLGDLGAGRKLSYDSRGAIAVSSRMENTLALITTYPSVAIGGTVFARLRMLLDQPLDRNDRSLMNHPGWFEISVLIEMAGYLVFESHSIVESYLAEIFFLIPTFLYIGPYAFRASLHSLLVNTIHSFTSQPNLSAEKRVHLEHIWSELCTSKGNLLFGLNKEMKTTDYDYLLMNVTTHLETCSAFLLDIISTVGSTEQANAWRARWGTCVVRTCFSQSPALQCRAFVVLGCIARIETEDVVVTEVVKVLGRSLSVDDDLLRDEYIYSTIFCLSKMVDGLGPESGYLGRLFWLSIALLNACSMSLFNHAAQLLQVTVRALDDYGAFKDMSMAQYLLNDREKYITEWNRISDLIGIQFSEEYFELAICASLLKGLEKSATRAVTAGVLEVLFNVSTSGGGTVTTRGAGVAEVSSHNDLYTVPLTPVVTVNASSEIDHIASPFVPETYPSYLCYLFFLFLSSRSDHQLKDILWSAGWPENEPDSSSSETKIPTILKNYIIHQNTSSLVAMFLGGQLFNACEDDGTLEVRYLECFILLGEMNITRKFQIYAGIRRKLKKIMDHDPNVVTVEFALAIAQNAIAHAHLLNNRNIYHQETRDMLQEIGFVKVSKKGDGSQSEISLRVDISELEPLLNSFILYEGHKFPEFDDDETDEDSEISV